MAAACSMIAVEPDDGGLAVAHRGVRQHRQRLANQKLAQLGAQRHELAEVVARHAGERVPDHRAGGDAGDRAYRRQSALAVDGVADDQQPANVHVYLPIRR